MSNESNTAASSIDELLLLRKRVAELDDALSAVLKEKEALSLSESRFRLMVESSGDIVFEIDHRGVVLYFSQGDKDVWGYDRDDVIGKNFIELIHPDDRDLLTKRFLELSAGVEKPLVYRIKNKSGEFRWVRTNTKPRIENGTFIGANGTLIDITDLKLAEESLRESEERYRDIIENTLDVYYRTDGQGNLIMMSPSGLALLGYESFGDILGSSVADKLYMFPEERVKFLSIMKEDGQVHDYEVVLKHQDGTPMPVSTSSRYYYDKDGNALGIEGFIRDIRDRKRAEKVIKESDELGKSILMSVPHGLFGVENRSIFFANAAMENVFGWKPEELIGKSTRILFRNEEEWKEYGAKLYSWLRKMPVVTFESKHPFVRKDGTEIICRNSVSRTGEKLGKTNRIVATFEDITDRRRAEESLKKSEERYRLLFESAGEGILIARGETIQFANPALLEILGCSEDVITSRPFVSFMHPDDREMVRNRHLNRMKGECVETDYTFRILRPDGTVKWLKISSRVILWDGLPSSLSFVVDVTGLKQIEEELRKSEQQQADIIDFLPDATLAIDNDKRVIIWNRAIEEMTGIPAQEMLGKGDYAYTIPFYGEARPQLMDLVMSDNEEFSTKYPQLRREGEALVAEAFCHALYNNKGAWVYAKATPLRDQKGNIKGIIEIIRDITKQKHYEDVLKDYQRSLADVINFLPDATFVIDKNGIVTAWNNAIASMTGIKAEEMIGRGNYEYAIPFYGERRPIIIDLILSEDDEFLRKSYDEVQRQVAVLSGEVYVPHAFGGKGAYLWGNASRLYDSKGEVVGAIQSIRDITERRQAEAERRDLEERLQRAEKMESLGLLAGGVAHDLNNVLGIVVGYAEMLIDEMDKSNPMRDDLKKILDGGNRSAAIVQDLLTLARRGVQTKKAANLNAAIADWLKTPEFERVFSNNPHIKLITDLESDLLNIMGSPVHLGKTIANLVSNAVEAMPNGGVLKIATRNRYMDMPIHGYDNVREGDYVVLTVSDTGEGILERDVKRIFEPFYTKKIMGRSGTGLGLAVVWGTIKDHNGYINVESEEGKGTTFALYFPITREDIDSEQISVSMSEYMGRGETILVVDDIKGQRELASRMLTKLNYSVSTVASGEEAVEYLKKNKADLIVLDMIMDPGIDGSETYEKVLEISPVQKAVIVSGFSESDRVREAQNMGAGAYVRKPYVLERIGMAVRKELDRK